MSITISEKVSSAARKDILELDGKINRFKNGEIDEEKFKQFRLTRGVYGQRQFGVQMFRTKFPYGKITPTQLIRMGELAETYTNGNLHLTTRQNIQLHYIKLEDTPEILNKMEEVGITAREACGNTVRNITASSIAGIDPEEPFDVIPYVDAVFNYFLRNPLCQEMGRKIKIAFSSSYKDSAFTFLHDFGFIPEIKDKVRGFRVVVGGGLGAQSMVAQEAFEFLPANELIPFIEAGLRVFDRYGEREKRYKARLKYLIQDKGLGLEGFLKLVEEERKALKAQKIEIEVKKDTVGVTDRTKKLPKVTVDQGEFLLWKTTNVIKQKQEGYFAVFIKVPLGNISASTAYHLAALANEVASDDIRITITQNLLFKFVKSDALEYLYSKLQQLDLGEPGADKVLDVTACPGTDTCNLGVTNSTGVALEIEKLIAQEFKHLITENFLTIKISGCMNSCGQHMVANIGLHGSSIKNGDKVIPALQLVLGGGVDAHGQHTIADKVIKLPSKRILTAIRTLFDDYEMNSYDDEYFNNYYARQGKRYFYSLLKSLGDVTNIDDSEYVDWGHNEDFVPEIGTGECAGVSLDEVGTIILDAEEKLFYAKEALDNQSFTDSIYNSYHAIIVGAKALLLNDDISCNTQIGIIKDFDEYFVASGKIGIEGRFEDFTLKINKNKPEEPFVTTYYNEAKAFIELVKQYRGKSTDKLVITDFYKA